MIKGSVLCISVLLLTACATQEVTPSQPNSVTVEDEVKALKQPRSQLQFQFANLAAIWWQRQGELVDTSSN